MMKATNKLRFFSVGKYQGQSAMMDATCPGRVPTTRTCHHELAPALGYRCPWVFSRPGGRALGFESCPSLQSPLSIPQAAVATIRMSIGEQLGNNVCRSITVVCAAGSSSWLLVLVVGLGCCSRLHFAMVYSLIGEVKGILALFL